MKRLVKNGTIVRATGSFEADLLIEGEKITAIGKDLDSKAAAADEVIDAKGKYVLPGAIDPHTHIAMQLQEISSQDDFETGTAAAACGGITCLVDFANQTKGGSIQQCVDRKRGLADGRASVDYSFHPAIVDPRPEIFDEIEKAVDEYGTPDFKVYYVYDFRIDDAALLRLLAAVKTHGGLVQLHAENVYVIDYMNEKLEKEGKLAPYYHAKSRPNLAEEEAVMRAIKMVELTNSQIYIVHLSTKEGLKRVQEARDRGLHVYAETCPQYLLFTEERYKEPDWKGAKYVMSPPLRTKESSEALWKGINSGDIQVMGTDHCPFDFRGVKDMFGKDDYKKIPNGSPGIETLLMVMHSEGVVKGKISLERMVDILSTGTARMFGLTEKGEIAVGKDADVVIFDPKQKFTVTREKLHMNVDYTPFEGWEITGMPAVVYCRGKKVAEWSDGQMVHTGEKGWGKFVKRAPFRPF